MNVICTVVILLYNNHRVVDNLHGVVVATRGERILVDFSNDMRAKNYDRDGHAVVFSVKENDCLYQE